MRSASGAGLTLGGVTGADILSTSHCIGGGGVIIRRHCHRWKPDYQDYGQEAECEGSFYHRATESHVLHFIFYRRGDLTLGSLSTWHQIDGGRFSAAVWATTPNRFIKGTDFKDALFSFASTSCLFLHGWTTGRSNSNVVTAIVIKMFEIIKMSVISAVNKKCLSLRISALCDALWKQNFCLSL